MNNKCVYVHKLNDEVVYVGSGTEYRVHVKIGKSEEHIMVWDKLERVIIEQNLSEYDAKVLEQKLINEYWQTGNLFNKYQTVSFTHNIDWLELSKYVEYDPSSNSCLRWKSGVRSGKEAGSLSTAGYYRVNINNVSYRCHRVIWSICNKTNLEKDLVIDHIDSNRGNNAICNLQAVSQKVNMRKKLHRESNTGCQAITDNKTQERFSVFYRDNGKVKYYLFNYSDKARKGKNKYPSRELAFEAALLVRDMLCDSGLINITREDKHGI